MAFRGRRTSNVTSFFMRNLKHFLQISVICSFLTSDNKVPNDGVQTWNAGLLLASHFPHDSQSIPLNSTITSLKARISGKLSNVYFKTTSGLHKTCLTVAREPEEEEGSTSRSSVTHDSVSSSTGKFNGPSPKSRASIWLHKSIWFSNKLPNLVRPKTGSWISEAFLS